MFSVYCHTNKKNGMRYIGITAQDPKARWMNGKGYSRNKKFYTAINKYGWENFDHKILADGLTENEAVFLEQKLIEEYDSARHGYNNSWGGKYVSKRALCHEANMIKKGLKDSHYIQLNKWVELFENAEKDGVESNLCQSLNALCQRWVADQKKNGYGVHYTDTLWLAEFLNMLISVSEAMKEN